MHSSTNLQRRIVRIESKILIHGKNGFAEILHLRKKNDFAEGSKILLDTDLKIILLNHQNNFVETLKKKTMLQKILIFQQLVAFECFT